MKKTLPKPSKASSTQPPGTADDGYMLIGVLFLVALLLITLAVAAPRVASELQRDKEEELVHRGLAYTRAIQLYYHKFGRYPSNLDQLENTNNIRFLRKRYKDPVTGKDEWRIIHFGEAKIKTTGLFGQPIANAGAAGSSVPGGGAQTGSIGGGLGSIPDSGAAGAGPAQGGAADGQTGGLTGGSSAFGSTTGGLGSGGLGPGGIGPGGSASNSLGATGQTFGGAGIVGVSSTSTKASIREFKKQKHYNEWEFVYDPLQEQNGQSGTGIVQQPGAQNPNSPAGSTGFGLGTNPPPGGTSPSPTPQQ